MENVSKNVEDLGIRLGQSRTKLNITQAQMADMISISRPNYTAIENGIKGRFLKDYQLRNAAKNLNVSSDYLLGLISDPNPNADIMAITKYLGISSSSINKLHSFNSEQNSSNILSTIDDFVNYSGKTFLDLIYLYKRLKKFYNNQYKFVLEFTKDIEYEHINIFNNNINWNRIQSNQKYFYYDVESAKNLYYYSFEIIEKYPDNFGKAFDLIMDSLKKGDYTESNLFLYKDTEKLNNFKTTLQNLRGILHDFIMIVDFDETGLIFSFGEKEDDIRKIIESIIEIIESSPGKPIDSFIENLHSCLIWFSNTVQYSLNFIKFRINNYFEEYLENN